MKTKEFNLSSKRKPFNEDSDCIMDYDVKEFIKKLKEGIHDYNETELGDVARNVFIDKLAGKEL